MNLKKSLIAVIVLAAGFATPAFAVLNVNIDIGIPVTRQAPPAPVYEVMPAPQRGHVWAPGYWAWNHDRYVWVRGRHIAQRPGYAWAPEHWEHRGDQYHFVSGDWRRDEHGDHDRGRGHAYGRDR